MGDMSEAVVEGECCEQCGDFFDDEAPGYPRTCELCKRTQKVKER